mmetsp:Transcript_46953/g.150906  ORF Transcript_46953/g.150906 Transcript_46953/m.150906 type:complete len:80 (+) Transcript_46953:119-358(+)
MGVRPINAMREIQAETVGIIHLAKFTEQTRWAAKALDTAEKKQCAWPSMVGNAWTTSKLSCTTTLGDETILATRPRGTP